MSAQHRVVELASVAKLSKGYTQIANTLLEAMCAAELSGRQFRVLNAIIRKTYGYDGKPEDYISASQIAKLIHYQGDETHIRADIRLLTSRNILVKKGRVIGVNIHLSDWILGAKTDRKQSAKQTENGPLTDRKRSASPDTAIDRKRSGAQTENGPANRPKTDPTKEKRNIFKEKDLSDLRENAPKNSDPVSDRPDSPPKPKPKRATSAPEKFEVTDELFNWAQREGVTVDLVSETEQFLDYHRGKGSTQKDWVATWRTWMRNSKKFSSQKPQRRNAAPETTADLIESAKAQAERIMSSPAFRAKYGDQS